MSQVTSEKSYASKITPDPVKQKTSGNSTTSSTATSSVKKSPQKEEYVVYPTVDAGCNLTHTDFADYNEILKDAEANGLQCIVNTASSFNNSRTGVEVVNAYNDKTNVQLLTTIGVGPRFADKFDVKTFNRLEELIRKNPTSVVAIGECGLDYTVDEKNSDVKSQRNCLQQQINLAHKYKKPLVVKSRSDDAFYELVEALKTVKTTKLYRCFTGNEFQARKLVEVDAYLGVTPLICQARVKGRPNHANRNLIAFTKVPLDRLVLCTNAPFLSFRYKDSTYPSDTTIVLETLAKALDMNISDLANVLESNTRKLFGLNEGYCIPEPQPSQTVPQASYVKKQNSSNPPSSQQPQSSKANQSKPSTQSSTQSSVKQNEEENNDDNDDNDNDDDDNGEYC